MPKGDTDGTYSYPIALSLGFGSLFLTALKYEWGPVDLLTERSFPPATYMDSAVLVFIQMDPILSLSALISVERTTVVT